MVLFWALMCLLAVVLWQMASKDKSGAPANSFSLISYSDFMAQVDKNNVSSVRLLESPATSEAEGQLREPPDQFRTTISKETIPVLTERLRKQGVRVEVSENNSVTWPRLLVNISPLLGILALWIFMARRRWRRNRSVQTSPAATPTIPTNRPLG
jgi:ATP-dependent Zn protease